MVPGKRAMIDWNIYTIIVLKTRIASLTTTHIVMISSSSLTVEKLINDTVSIHENGNLSTMQQRL